MQVLFNKLIIILAVLISQSSFAGQQRIEDKFVTVSTQWQLDTVGTEVLMHLRIKCNREWSSIKLPSELLASGRLMSVSFLGFTSEFNQLVVHNSRLLENTDLFFEGKAMRDRTGNSNDTNRYILNLEIVTICRYLKISGYDSLNFRSRVNCQTANIYT